MVQESHLNAGDSLHFELLLDDGSMLHILFKSSKKTVIELTGTYRTVERTSLKTHKMVMLQEETAQ